MYWYVSIYSEESFWPQYMYHKMSPNNGFRWCPLGKFSHLGLEQLNAEGKCQREFQAEVNADKCHRFHESYEIKWVGERDADEYRKKVAKERRDNPDELIAKDKEILATAENLAKKEQYHAEIEKG